MGKYRSYDKDWIKLDKEQTDTCARCGNDQPLIRWGKYKNLCWSCRQELRRMDW